MIVEKFDFKSKIDTAKEPWKYFLNYGWYKWWYVEKRNLTACEICGKCDPWRIYVSIEVIRPENKGWHYFCKFNCAVNWIKQNFEGKSMIDIPKTDTPETDNALQGVWYRGDHGSAIPALCRKLERERDELKNIVIKWRDSSDQELRLRCGELTAQEIRAIRAVLNAILPKN